MKTEGLAPQIMGSVGRRWLRWIRKEEPAIPPDPPRPEREPPTPEELARALLRPIKPKKKPASS